MDLHTKRMIVKTIASLSAVAALFSLAACGADSNFSVPAGYTELKGVTAEGEPGKEPKITIEKDAKIPEQSVALLQQGNGDTIKENDQVCTQVMVLDGKTHKVLQSTWKSNTPDCSLRIDKKVLNEGQYELFKGAKLNSSYAFGLVQQGQQIQQGNAKDKTATPSELSYIYVITPVRIVHNLERAKGKEVKNIPSDLPKVTLEKDGAPKIDMNGYKGSNSLVVQPLIQGDGPAIKETDTVFVHYTGWLLDGKKFDSSWDRHQSASFRLNGVIKGWKDGLKGQKVGSQVLLIVPPSEGYGDKEAGKIPPNSTLVFVVDILGKN